jgi:hypothetical protein
VAHREEILRQALRTYREVLRDPEFGDLLTGGHEPERWDHLFATIDSVTSRDLVAALGADHWHTVVVDECHRLAADRFDAFVKAVRPRVLLGLTATPERSDGSPSRRTSMRGPMAARRSSCACGTRWTCSCWRRSSTTPATTPPTSRPCPGTARRARGGRQPGHRQRRARPAGGQRVAPPGVRCLAVPRPRVLRVGRACRVHDRLAQPRRPAGRLRGGHDEPEERRRAPQRLLSGELCALVTVDLYNEGIDLPMVDTLLLLRPTQSPVLFQQQIGRGLRLAPGKESCLVLDFVGQHRAEFRFDRLLSSLTGLSRRELVDGVENGFGSLPPGCHIHLQRQTREQVLQGLRT